MTERPPVIVMKCDQMKATASHLDGNTFCQTPSMERLAGEGVLFRHAVTPHPLCVPARISFWIFRRSEGTAVDRVVRPRPERTGRLDLRGGHNTVS